MRHTTKKLNTNVFMERAKLIHGDKYSYSLSEYINSKTKIKIICSEHGIFEQTSDKHINNEQGCPKCVGKNKNTNEFILESKIIHNNLFDYRLFEYNGTHIKSKIICPKHGIFEQDPHNHLKGKGCPICKESKGEKQISEILTNSFIKFIRQYRFFNCKDKKPLPFDFYLPDYNICIEFDGRQHFESIPNWGGEKTFFEIQKRDKIKEQYCKINDIKLIRVKYTDNINEKLKNVC